MASSSAAYDGGAGGKFRKNTSRSSHTTPYDRPITALRRPTQTLNNNDNNNSNNRWLSKIIDPATKLINSGANKLFSSVFRKHLTDEVKKIEYVQPANVTNVVDYGTNLPVTCGDNGCSGPSNSKEVAKLEDILKQKTSTRSEIDQLTALIRSRTTENSNVAEKGMSEPKLVDLEAVQTRRDKLSNPANENYVEHALSGNISTPKVRSKVHPDDVVSPVEIAKAYMASTHSRLAEVSPSVLYLQNPPKENISSYSSLSKSISPAMYLNQKAVGVTRTSRNGFMTPTFRGRSIVHSIARTPYSSVRPATAFKAAENNYNIDGGSSYHNVTENNHYRKQALKRRSSVLENDIGFVGSIRRVRQKPNFLCPKIPEVRSSVEGSFQNGSFSNMPVMNSLPGTSSRYVPSRSIEMAEKIFEQLDKFSPKGNPKTQADVSIENSPTCKRLPSSHDVKEPKCLLDSVHEHSHPTESSSMVEEVSAKKFTSPSFSFGPQRGADSGLSGDVTYSASKSKADRPMKKRAFDIGAHKALPSDYPEMDDDVPSNEAACSAPLTEGGYRAELPRKSIAIADILSKDQTSPVKKLPEMKTSANTTISDAVIAPQSTVESEEVAPQIEKSNFFTAFSSKSDNLPPFVCTPQSATKDTKVESPVSSMEVAAEVNSPDKTVNNNTQLFDNPAINSGHLPSVQVLSNGSRINTTTLFNGGQPSFTPSFASNTTDISCDKSNAAAATTTTTTSTVTTSSLINAAQCALSSGGNSIFSFTAPTLESTGCDVEAAVPATTNKPTFSFQTDSTPVSALDFASAPSYFDQSPCSVSAPRPAFVFDSSRSTGLTSGSDFGSISANPFSSGPTTTSSALDNTFTSSLVSTSSSTTPSIFCFSSQTPKPTTTPPAFSLPTFSFGPVSSGVTSSSFNFRATANSSSAGNTPFVFGANSALAASTPELSNSLFHSQPLSTTANRQPFSFISTTPTNSRQSPMEDTMAEDSPPGFGAQVSVPTVGFGFNAPSSASSSFQFNTQQGPIAPQNPLFQPSGSGEFSGGSGSFSLGTTDKSQRRIIRVKRGVRGIKKQ